MIACEEEKGVQKREEELEVNRWEEPTEVVNEKLMRRPEEDSNGCELEEGEFEEAVLGTCDEELVLV